MLERMGKWGRKMTRGGSRGQEEKESGREIWKENVADYFPRWLQEYHPPHMLLLSSCKNLSEYVTQKGCYAIKGDSFHRAFWGCSWNPVAMRKQNHMEEATGRCSGQQLQLRSQLDPASTARHGNEGAPGWHPDHESPQPLNLSAEAPDIVE